ncbi:PAS domain S-box protein [Roseomonas populi]|uniref:histidine kinase n=1 Tax=Roseomonas populi TaxID=3121582 RepID=A0ABT1X4Q8_9PROT|nr:PAS domain S-box protein [Roseomonas pecuniae]MCR0983091.1 PAS domain S-box protein [Roseomonas pecuniae]
MSGSKVGVPRSGQLSRGRLAELVLESTADFAIFTTDLDGIITSWNAPAERIMGWSEAEAVGQDACMIFTPEDQAKGACEQEMETARKDGRAVDERWHLRKDGTHFWGSGSMTRLEETETGEHLGYVKIIRDRTEQASAEELLRETSTRLHGFAENSADVLWIIDAGERRLEYLSPAYERVWGEPRDRIMRDLTHWAETVHPEDRQRVLSAMPRLLGGEAQVLEYRILRPDGGVRWIRDTGFPIRGHGDAIVRVAGISHDVTVEREAVEALRHSEERLRTALSIRTVGVLFWGPGFSLTEVNDAFLRMTGFSREEVIGKTWQELTPPEFHRASRKAVQELTTFGEATPYEKQYYRKDGSRWWGLFAPRRVNGEAVEFVLDVTDRRRTEEALRQSEERYRLAVRATNDAIWDWDLRQNSIEWNEALHEAYGYRPEDVGPSGDWWIEQIHPDDRERVSGSIHVMIDGTSSRWSGEYRFRRADGSYADVLDRGFMVRGPDGEPLRIIGAMLDVTERRRSERELRQLNEHLEIEVSRRTEELRRHEDALRQSQKLEAVGQLTGGVAHDFNNLLTIIGSSAELLRRPNLSEGRRQRYIEAISETAGRAAKLTRQLLAFARRQPLQPEAFAVGERVQAVTDLVRPLVGARIAIRTLIECEGCVVEADPNQFETALVNLAVNARDAMEGEGRLTLRTWLAHELPPTRGHAGTRSEFVAVSMSDTGAGIRPEVLGSIFEPFFTTKEVGKGTGLGLSQVYGFAKQSGGEIHVESEVGQGTIFTLYLPKAEAKPLLAARASGASAEAHEPEGRCVLLVEDNTQVGDFAKQLLEDLGYTATWAPNAQAALDFLEQDASRFDVVFSDVVMPGMNGVELGKEVRRRWPDLRVVLTSGYSHVLANGGAQGFELLHKPYSADGLSRALRSVR